jgi:uncharacterized protein (DUF1778 family)
MDDTGVKVRRTKPLATVATADEAQIIAAAAERMGHSVAAFLRWSALGRAAEITPAKITPREEAQ